LLAHFLPQEVERFLAEPLERFTDRTVTDPSVVRERIHQAQIDGFAWTRDEYAEGITSVAAAVADDEGEVVGAIHVHGPSYRFPPSGTESVIASRVLATAARVTASLRLAATAG